MTSEANRCPTCGKSTVADPANPDANCKGHAAAGNMKAQLDAIKTPGSAGAPAAKPAAKPVPSSVPAPKMASSQQNMKAALDAIPSPGAAKSAPAPAPAAAPAAKVEPSIADQLNAIPTPGSAGAKPPASITKNQLDAIPTPGAKAPEPAPAPAPGGLSFADQLNAIPTPGMTSSPRTSASSLDAIPTPKPAAPPPQNPADQPEWMKKFNQYQSGITASSASGFPAQEDPYANYRAPVADAPAKSNNGGYMMIAILVGALMIGYFVVLTMNKPAPLDTTKIGAPESTASPSGLNLPGTPVTPSSSLPGTPVQQPFQQPAYTQPGTPTP